MTHTNIHENCLPVCFCTDTTSSANVRASTPSRRSCSTAGLPVSVRVVFQSVVCVFSSAICPALLLNAVNLHACLAWHAKSFTHCQLFKNVFLVDPSFASDRKSKTWLPDIVFSSRLSGDAAGWSDRGHGLQMHCLQVSACVCCMLPVACSFVTLVCVLSLFLCSCLSLYP